jgi:hypothetical protein
MNPRLLAITLAWSASACGDVDIIQPDGLQDTTPSDTDAPTQDSDPGPSETDADTDAPDTASPGPAFVRLRFQQLVRYGSSYEARGSHEIWIGPADASPPTDASWVRVADDAALRAETTVDAWRPFEIDLTAAARAQGWETFRVAFHYRGANADNWYLDAICLSTFPYPGDDLGIDCDRLWIDMEAATSGDLPPEGSVAPGPDNAADPAWGSTTNAGPSFQGSRSLYAAYSSDLIDQFLVLTP